MSTVHITTLIHGPAERVFKLCRSATLYKMTMQDTDEKIISGRITGLLELNETITWRGKHLRKFRQYTFKVTGLEAPVYYKYEMIKGDLKNMVHEQHFNALDNGTILIDIFRYDPPSGLIGKIYDRMYVKKYLQQLLLKRNKALKLYAESERWRMVLE